MEIVLLKPSHDRAVPVGNEGVGHQLAVQRLLEKWSTTVGADRFCMICGLRFATRKQRTHPAGTFVESRLDNDRQLAALDRLLSRLNSQRHAQSSPLAKLRKLTFIHRSHDEVVSRVGNDRS